MNWWQWTIAVVLGLIVYGLIGTVAAEYMYGVWGRDCNHRNCSHDVMGVAVFLLWPIAPIGILFSRAEDFGGWLAAAPERKEAKQNAAAEKAKAAEKNYQKALQLLKDEGVNVEGVFS